jgi:hypothetical protein
MPPAVATPNLLTDPGFLWWAPFGTVEPTNGGTVAGSKFTDSLSASYIPMGATAEGSTFSTAVEVEAVIVAELFNPVRYATTGRTSGLAFAMADFTANNLKRANNGGTVATVSGTGATLLTKYEESDPGAEVRCLLVWQSLDDTVRIIMRQCFNSGTIEAAFQRAPAFAQIAVNFQFEQPTGAKPYTIYFAGAARVGT